MSTFASLLPFIGGHRLPEEHDGPATRIRLVALVAGISAVLCALYGLAAGTGTPSLMVANLFKLPMVVLLSTVGALPAGLLAWKLLGSEQRASDLVVGAASGVLTGSLVLAVLAPLVALYYQTSSWLGPALAMTAALVATLTGTVIAARAVLTRAQLPEVVDAAATTPTLEEIGGLPAEARGKALQAGKLRRKARRTALAPMVVMSVVQLATLAQLIAVASPILNEETVFDGGLETLLGG